MSNAGRERWLAAAYAATIFVSAFLLFQVQPVVTKHILPWFGGTPAVWTVCMFFFQLLLLAGYVYVHVGQKWLRPAQQFGAQLALIAAALSAVLWWRILPGESWRPMGEDDPARQIVVMLAISVGLPFFVLSTTAPLVQAWFARSFPGRVPYRLYALSNLGSLLALVTYPFFVEWAFDLRQQALLWSLGFLAYSLFCGMVALGLWRAEAKRPTTLDAGDSSLSAENVRAGDSGFRSPAWWQRALWLTLPALGTVALLATTNHVCANVAVVPFLWVVPLALYLLTFIIAFDHTRWYHRTSLAAVTLAAIYAASLVSFRGPGWIDLYQCGTTGRLLRMAAGIMSNGQTAPVVAATSPTFYVGVLPFLALNFAAMFGFCMLCHGELVRQRPHPRFLTSFYLMIAAGGVVGAIAVSLIAPRVFSTYFEWPLFMFFGAIWAISLVLHKCVQAAFPIETKSGVWRFARAGALAALVVLIVPMAIGLLDLVEFLQVPENGIVFRERNFFGSLAVRETRGDTPQDDVLFLYHGIIVHGSQYEDASRRGQPTTYYSTVSGAGRTVAFYRRYLEPRGLNVGVVGLGTGTLAAYLGGGDVLTYYEINPAIVEIAESGRWFTYLNDFRARGGNYEIKLGDARVALERDIAAGRPGRFHVLVLDAFSGDAIPIHLLTAEAFELYAQHLATAATDGADGALVVHISNRYLDLEPVVRGAAGRLGFSIAHIHSRRDPDHGIYEAEWMVLTRNASLLEALLPHAVVAEGPAKPAIHWTDKRSNLLEVVK